VTFHIGPFGLGRVTTPVSAPPYVNSLEWSRAHGVTPGDKFRQIRGGEHVGTGGESVEAGKASCGSGVRDRRRTRSGASRANMRPSSKR